FCSSFTTITCEFAIDVHPSTVELYRKSWLGLAVHAALWRRSLESMSLNATCLGKLLQGCWQFAKNSPTSQPAANLRNRPPILIEAVRDLIIHRHALLLAKR